MIARGADDLAAGSEVDHGERQPVALGEALQRALDIAAGVVGLGHARDPDVPELAVGGGALQAVDVLQAERLEADPVVASVTGSTGSSCSR